MIEIILSCGLAAMGIFCLILSSKLKDAKTVLSAAERSEAMLVSRNAEMQKELTDAREKPPSLELQEFINDMTSYDKGILIVTRAPVEGTLLRGFNGAK